MKYAFFSLVLFGVLTFEAGPEIPPEMLEKYYLPDTIALSEYNTTLPIKDLSDAHYLGQLLFHMRTNIAKVSCADCHNSEKSFFSESKKPRGGQGLFNEMYARRNPDFPVDIPGVKTPTIVNSFLVTNSLWGGELGNGGFNEDIPDSTLLAFMEGNNADGVFSQVVAASHAHFQSDLALEIKFNPFMVGLSKSAFDTEKIDLELVRNAIGVYEKSVITNQNNINKFIRGTSNKIHSKDGLLLYDEHCYDCHNKPTLAPKIVHSAFEGRFRLTHDENDRNMLKVPRLENIKDSNGFFHTSADISLYKTIQAHNFGLTRKEINRIKKFLEKDLHDDNLERYTKYN